MAFLKSLLYTLVLVSFALRVANANYLGSYREKIKVTQTIESTPCLDKDVYGESPMFFQKIVDSVQSCTSSPNYAQPSYQPEPYDNHSPPPQPSYQRQDSYPPPSCVSSQPPPPPQPYCSPSSQPYNLPPPTPDSSYSKPPQPFYSPPPPSNPPLEPSYRSPAPCNYRLPPSYPLHPPPPSYTPRSCRNPPRPLQ